MMKTKVLTAIKKYNMIPNGGRVIVALSGGSDSMSLLDVLSSLKEELGITLEAAHVNHCLRGKDSDSDEAFVAAECEKRKIRLHRLRADVSGRAEENGESLEEAGRRIRYDFFASLGDDALIATAHNLSDRTETFLFNFTRGSGLKGLCSIPPVRGNIIRPLIECSKQEIEQYCAENSVEYVTDRTNSDVTYSRNRIRHNVIPELKRINPAFEECAGRCIDLINEDGKYLYSLACSAVTKAECGGGYEISELSSLALPVLKRALSIITEKEKNIQPDSRMINEMLALVRNYSVSGHGGSVQLSGETSVRARAGKLEFPCGKASAENEKSLVSGENFFGSFLITLTESRNVTDYSQTFSNMSANYVLDRDKIQGRISVRVRNEGDVMRPFPRNVTKPLRKLQNEAGISPELRTASPVIVDAEGIIACFGCGVDSRVKADKKTENAVILRIEYKGEV